MKISFSYSGTLAHPSKARTLEQRLKDLEAELKAEGLTGKLSVSDTEQYDTA